MSPSLRGVAVNAILLLGLLAASHPATAGSIEYIHTDALGTPVAITDADRNVLQRSEYEPYGKLLNRPAEDGPGFTGHVTDQATGLSYMQQRYYDPAIGRFLSVDPVTPDGNGSSFNRYGYASENPYRFTDPDGRHPSELQRREAAGTRGDAGASGIEGYNPLRSNNGAHQNDAAKAYNNAIASQTKFNPETALAGSQSPIKPLVSCNQTHTCIPLDKVDLGGKTLMKVIAIPYAIGITGGIGVTVATPEALTAVGTQVPTIRNAALGACMGVGLCGPGGSLKRFSDLDAFVEHARGLQEAAEGAMLDAEAWATRVTQTPPPPPPPAP
jgi:RHS repeat-associated protein